MATIQISKETQKKLFEVAAKLQLKLRRRVSLDETIRYLLTLHEGGRRKEKFASFYGCARGDEAEKARKLLYELRAEEDARLEKLGG